MKKVLIACEESQIVTKEFRELGIEAFSCDIIPCSGGHPEWHLQQDVIPLLTEKWDMLIAFPPCTYLTVTGNKWFKPEFKDRFPNRIQQRKDAIRFFLNLYKADIPKIAIENPIGIMSSWFRKPNQIIQPWQFGHPEKKATCLWLTGLPILQITKNVHKELLNLSKNKQQRLHYLPPSKNRSLLRSKTYSGIAKAMATQWSKCLK